MKKPENSVFGQTAYDQFFAFAERTKTLNESDTEPSAGDINNNQNGEPLNPFDAYEFLDDGDPPTEVEIKAAQWLRRLKISESSNELVSDLDKIKFIEWYVENPEHKKKFHKLRRLLEASELPEGKKNLDENSEAKKDAGGIGSPYGGPEVPKRSLFFWVCAGSAASALMVAIVWVIQVLDSAQIKTQKNLYQTAVGEQRTETLSDGTTIFLNTDTQLRVVFEQNVRKISLLHGEVFFDVVKDRRPFVVLGGSGLVRVTGTAFEVRVAGKKMLVSVERGQVVVSPRNRSAKYRELTPRQQISVVNHRLGETHELDETVADWRDGVLEFRDRALGEILFELDKYYDGNIHLVDEHLRRKRMNGQFPVRDIPEIIRNLAVKMGLDYVISDNGDLTLLKPGGAKPKTEG